MRKKIEKFKYFPQAWWFLQDHPKLKDFGVMQALDIFVTKVNPKTDEIDDDKNKNTETAVWLEFGFPEHDEVLEMTVPAHDTDLDCGAPTFEEAIVILANLVNQKYVINDSEEKE